jgi:hypothetical protein
MADSLNIPCPPDDCQAEACCEIKQKEETPKKPSGFSLSCRRGDKNENIFKFIHNAKKC